MESRINLAQPMLSCLLLTADALIGLITTARGWACASEEATMPGSGKFNSVFNGQQLVRLCAADCSGAL